MPLYALRSTQYSRVAQADRPLAATACLAERAAQAAEDQGTNRSGSGSCWWMSDGGGRRAAALGAVETKMDRRSFLGAVVVGGLGLGVSAAPARADHDDYRGYRYFRGRDREEIRQREFLRHKMFDLADCIRLALREGDLSRQRAHRFYERLDDVRDFLRDDRHLSDSEFGRRRDDLRDVGEDLRRALRRADRYDRFYRDRDYRDRDPRDRDYYRDRDRDRDYRY
jgi:hypothetical protein